MPKDEKGEKESNFNKLWDLVEKTGIWDGLIRGIRFTPEELEKRSQGAAEILSKQSKLTLSMRLNEIPEDIKQSVDSIKQYIRHKRYLEDLEIKGE